ncbi:MAG: hypothetical protein HY035_01055 [Nitrospirae bacterium]|nr:hypothetical protein [Nitrospirota bacterium]MBI3376978.1 hypothetical protein [Nitrospirota bacterium]
MINTLHQPHRRRPKTGKEKRLFGVGLDAFVVHGFIIFFNSIFWRLQWYFLNWVICAAIVRIAGYDDLID